MKQSVQKQLAAQVVITCVKQVYTPCNAISLEIIFYSL